MHTSNTQQGYTRNPTSWAPLVGSTDKIRHNTRRGTDEPVDTNHTVVHKQEFNLDFMETHKPRQT